MSQGPFHAELRQLRTMLAGPLTDADLIHRFVEQRDEAAFAGLVRRHGALVLQVCRNVLHQDADADDAFQATFLVLARKAGSFRKGTSLASWLHGVAYRCSMNLRKSAMRRHARERAAAGGRSPESSATRAAWNELQERLHEEVERLPAPVRAAFVLCVLEDKGRAEAARTLGCPEGTLASRLAKARKILQKRLTARGVTLSAALSAAAIATGAASASAALIHETTMAALAFAAGNAAGAMSAQALALARSVLKGMLLTKAKIGAVLMIAVLLGVVAGGSLVAQPNGPEVPAKKIVAPNPAPQAANDKPETGGDKPAHVDPRGDALPDAALVRLGSARMRHGGKIHSSKLSPDGKTLATAGDNAVIVWDLESGEAVHRFECDQSESMPDPPLVFAPDGSRLAYVRNLGFGRIWDLRTGKELHRIEKKAGEGVFVDHGKAFLYPARLADSKLHKLDLGSGRITESTSFRCVNFVRISPDGKTMLEVLEKNLTLRELPSGNRLSVWDASVRPNEVFSQVGVVYSPDSKTVAIVHDHRQIQLRSVPAGDVVASFPLPETAEFFSPPIKLDRRAFRFRLGFSLDSRTLLLATTQGTVHRWDLASGKELPVLAKYPASIEGAHILPDGRTVITAGSDGVLLKWNTTTGRPQPEPESYEGPITSAYSGDGRFAAIGDARGRVDLWDARSGKAIRTLRREGAVAAHLAFAPDSKLLAMAEPSGTVRSWRIPSGEAGVLHEHRPAKGEWDCNGGIQFSPDGRLLSINDNGPFRLRVIEIATGKELWSDFGTICSAFSADGTTLIVMPSPGSELAVLDSKSGKLKSMIRLEPDPSTYRLGVSSIVPSPDRRTVAVIYGGGILSLLDSRTGLECQRLIDLPKTMDDYPRAATGAPSKERPAAIAYSADSHWLASGGDFGGITIWDVASGEELLRLSGHDGKVTELAFSPDGRTLSSFGVDAQGYRWNLEPKPADGRRASFAELWDALDQPKPADAYRAQWRLIADPKGAMAFLRDHLKPIPAPDADKIRKWIGELDNEAFSVREAASDALTKLGEPVLLPVQEAIEKKTSGETYRRLKQILRTVSNERVPRSVRSMRAILVLERIGSPEAREVLEAMSRGARGTRVTLEASAALQRLDKLLAQGP